MSGTSQHFLPSNYFCILVIQYKCLYSKLSPIINVSDVHCAGQRLNYNCNCDRNNRKIALKNNNNKLTSQCIMHFMHALNICCDEWSSYKVAHKKRIMNPMGIITIVITYIIAQVQANFLFEAIHNWNVLKFNRKLVYSLDGLCFFF